MIIVGGTGRNIGKTTLAEKLIEKFSEKIPVTAVKMANIKPETIPFHGHDVSTFSNKLFIEKETSLDGGKDSMRFLKAGAATSWFIQTEDAFLAEIFPEIYSVLKKAKWIICESNSLTEFIKPAIFIMVNGGTATHSKKNISRLLSKSDVIVESLQWELFDGVVKRIEVKNGQFLLEIP